MDEEFFAGFIAAGFFAALIAFTCWLTLEQHDIAVNHNVCMIVDEANTMRCVNGSELLEILRKGR